jgi:hypothetical protein
MGLITKKDVELSTIQVHGAGEMVSKTYAMSVIEQLEDALQKVIDDSVCGVVPRSHLDKIEKLLSNKL